MKRVRRGAVKGRGDSNEAVELNQPTAGTIG